MKFTIVNNGYPMDVHKHGCKDAVKAVKTASSFWDVEAADVAEAVKEETAELNSQFEHQYNKDELFRVLPCCKR